jgi:hypothetical protein
MIKQMLINKCMDLIYGKPQLIRTEDAPGIIHVSIHMPDKSIKQLECAPKQEIWKRPRQSQITIKGVYLQLPYAIPYPHSIMYRSDFIEDTTNDSDN